MSDCSHQCGGRCCQGFYLSHPPERVGELYLNALAHVIAFEPPYDWEILFIAEMLIRIDEPDEANPVYTCQHFVVATGLCGVYDARPSMCRRFPYGRVCDYGCGYQNELPANELVAIEGRPEPETTATTTEPENNERAA